MDLKEIMQKTYFTVLGNTKDETKYAYRIKKGLIEAGYIVECVDKELASINDTINPIEVLDLCIHPVKGLKLLKECTKKIEMVVIQPGAESDEIKAYLNEKEIPYLEGCLLVGLSLYKK